MMIKKNSRINPLQKMWKAPKPSTSEVETHIDMCNDLLGRAGASMTERANAAADGKSEAKIFRRSRGGQHRPKGKHEPEALGQETDIDPFEAKLKAVAITNRRVKGSQEELMVDFQERRRRRQSEKLVVDFPSESARARRIRRAHRTIASTTTESRKPRLKNSVRTTDTEDSFDDVIEGINRNDRVKNQKKEEKKKKKNQILGDFTDKFDWSESSIVWGDEECSSDEGSSRSHEVCKLDPSGANFTSTMFRKSSGGERSILSGSGHRGRRRSRDPTFSRSVMSAGSTESSRSIPLWQSFSAMNVSRKKLEP